MSLTLLFFLFNTCIFFNISNIIDHIHNYLINLERIKLYYNIIEQIAGIFEIESFLLLNHIKNVKNDKRGKTKNKLLLMFFSFLLCLPTITRLLEQGVIAIRKLSRFLISIERLAVIGFFCACYESKKTPH